MVFQDYWQFFYEEFELTQTQRQIIKGSLTYDKVPSKRTFCFLRVLLRDVENLVVQFIGFIHLLFYY